MDEDVKLWQEVAQTAFWPRLKAAMLRRVEVLKQSLLRGYSMFPPSISVEQYISAQSHVQGQVAELYTLIGTIESGQPEGGSNA